MKLRVQPLKFPLRLAWQCITHLCSCFYGRFPIGFLEAIQNAKWRWITLILSHHQMLWVCQEIFKQICLIWGPRWNFGNQIAACLQQLRWLQVGSWLGPCFIRRCSPSITIAGNHSELRAYLGGLEPWNFIFHFIKKGESFPLTTLPNRAAQTHLFSCGNVRQRLMWAKYGTSKPNHWLSASTFKGYCCCWT